MSHITLKTSDDQLLSVPIEEACMSTLIKDLVDDMADMVDDNDSNISIPYPMTILEKIFIYCHERKDDVPKEANDKPRHLTEWEEAYCNMPTDEKLELTKAANFLNIPSLLNALCLSIGHMINGKTKDELKEAFEKK